MTRSGRHAAGRPPSPALPLAATVFLIALAASGWVMFAKAPGAEPYALTGDQSRLPRRPSRPAAATAPAEAAPAAAASPPRTRTESSRTVPLDTSSTAPGRPPLDLPRARIPQPLELPQLLPKTTAELKRLTGAVTGLNWSAVARCESSNDPQAVSRSGFYGLYQFTRETWESVGGTGLPSQASPEEQTRRAQLLYHKTDGRWQGLWPRCGHLLFLK